MENTSISMDIEGTLADIQTPWIKKARKEYGIEITLDTLNWDLNNVKIENALEIFQKDIDELWEHNWKSIPTMEPDLGKKLRKIEYDIVTGRNKTEEIRKWLDYNKIPYNDVIFAKNGAAKLELGYLIYIDDDPGMHKKLKEGQIQILFERPWNRHVKGSENVIRAKNFDYVLRAIESLKKKS